MSMSCLILRPTVAYWGLATWNIFGLNLEIFSDCTPPADLRPCHSDLPCHCHHHHLTSRHSEGTSSQVMETLLTEYCWDRFPLNGDSLNHHKLWPQLCQKHRHRDLLSDYENHKYCNPLHLQEDQPTNYYKYFLKNSNIFNAHLIIQ